MAEADGCELLCGNLDREEQYLFPDRMDGAVPTTRPVQDDAPP